MNIWDIADEKMLFLCICCLVIGIAGKTIFFSGKITLTHLCQVDFFYPVLIDWVSKLIISGVPDLFFLLLFYSTLKINNHVFYAKSGIWMAY